MSEVICTVENGVGRLTLNRPAALNALTTGMCEAMIAALQQVVEGHTIYRVKGFAALPGAAMRLVIQGVGRRFDSYFDRRWQAGEIDASAPLSRFVMIGEDLDQATLQRALDEALSAQTQQA